MADPLTPLDMVAPRVLLAECMPGVSFELLTRRQALILALVYVRGLSVPEAASVMRVSKSAAYALHDRACAVIESSLACRSHIENVLNVHNVDPFEPSDTYK